MRPEPPTPAQEQKEQAKREKYEWRLARLKLARPEDRWTIIIEPRDSRESDKLQLAAEHLPGGFIKPPFKSLLHTIGQIQPEDHNADQ